VAATTHGDEPRPKTALEEEPLSPELSVSGPWHFTNIWITLAETPEDIESYCVAFSIETEVTGDLPIYISPINQRLNDIPLYGGIQTNIDGFEDKSDAKGEKVYRKRGAIFSRWEERDVNATRQAPGGLFESGGYEGDFISVRNDFPWSVGSYRLCLVKGDTVDGPPLPAEPTKDDVAYGWGRFAHTWVRMEATDVGTGETVLVGALAFPGRTLTLRRENAIFYEAYGSRSIRPADARGFDIVFDGIEVDGEPAAYSKVVESVNPFRVHADAPIMVRSSYRSGGGIASRVGIFTGDYGNATSVLYEP